MSAFDLLRYAQPKPLSSNITVKKPSFYSGLLLELWNPTFRDDTYAEVMDVVTKIKKFFYYWYTRYLLATELYILEPWEIGVVHVVFSLLFLFFWYFNYSVVQTGMQQLRSASPNVEDIS